MRYKATRSSYRHFEIRNEDDDLLGTLDYEGFFLNKVIVVLANNDVFKITPGVFRTNVTITRNDIPYAEITYNWWNSMNLIFEDGTWLIFKRRKVWSNSFLLTDKTQMQFFATIKAYFVWQRWAFDYTIEMDWYQPGNTNQFLPFILTYCAQHARRRRAVIY